MRRAGLWTSTFVLAAMASAGCGSTNPGPSVKVASTETVPAEAVADQAPLARPGEVMRYTVAIHGLELAEVVMAVGEPTTLDGVNVLPVATMARTTKVAAMLAPEEDHFDSWIDVANGRPVLYRSSEPASRSSKVLEVTEARFGGKEIAIRVEREDLGLATETQAVRTVGHDINSLLVFLRGWEGGVGARLETEVMRSRFAWRAELAVTGYEELDTALGRMPALRIDGEGVRITRDGAVHEQAEKRRFTIWITDDADRVMLRMTARTDYGDIVMSLVEYDNKHAR